MNVLSENLEFERKSHIPGFTTVLTVVSRGAAAEAAAPAAAASVSISFSFFILIFHFSFLICILILIFSSIFATDGADTEVVVCGTLSEVHHPRFKECMDPFPPCLQFKNNDGTHATFAKFPRSFRQVFASFSKFS